MISGPNGSGKTTLLRTIAGEIPPLAGEVRLGPSARIGYFPQDQSILESKQHRRWRAVQPYFRNQTQARSFLAGFFSLNEEPLKPVAQLSYGQRARLMLAVLITQEYNVLLLDEPINHLDIPSRAQFEEALEGFPGAVIAVVHDRYFIERFADEIWWVEDGQINVE